MAPRSDHSTLSLMGQSALIRLAVVAVGLVLLWGAIAWAVALP